MSENYFNTIIVGGGSSGLMTAVSASENSDQSVCILEKNPVVGKKLSISGGGRCNITNNTPDPKDFLEHFPQSKQFLYSAFSQYSMPDTEEFFTKNGLSLVTIFKKRGRLIGVKLIYVKCCLGALPR